MNIFQIVAGILITGSEHEILKSLHESVDADFEFRGHPELIRKEKMKLKKTLLISLILSTLFVISGCSWYASSNKKSKKNSKISPNAQFIISKDRGSNKNGKTLFIMAFSGGGSRAAYFSASSMFALQRVFKDEGLDLLKEVDAITAVSGGTLPAAYYTFSYDLPGKSSLREWDEKSVKKLMSRRFKTRWIANWFWPHNLFRYWFTAFDRSDIMAKTLADNLFDKKYFGRDFRYRDMNPERPNLIINATNATGENLGDLFAFTDDSFRELNSNLSKYRIANAVMASATFPGVFNYVTLRNYKLNNYIHLFDGGNRDNLGIESVINIMEKNATYDRIIVISVDSFIRSKGMDAQKADPRSGTDYIFDSNFLESFDSLLIANRKSKIENFEKYIKLKYPDKSKIIFYHLGFSDIKSGELNKSLNEIKTDFNIKKRDVEIIDKAVSILITKENNCLQDIKNIIVSGSKTSSEVTCEYYK